MPTPAWVTHLDAFWGWLLNILEESGGYLINDELDVQLLGPDETNPEGLLIHDQRLRFWDESFLEFSMVINADLVHVEYGFHYQGRDGEFIWRKDKHAGHEEEVGDLSHIHDNPDDPDECRFHSEVNLAEVIEEIHLYQEAATEDDEPPSEIS